MSHPLFYDNPNHEAKMEEEDWNDEKDSIELDDEAVDDQKWLDQVESNEVSDKDNTLKNVITAVRVVLRVCIN